MTMSLARQALTGALLVATACAGAGADRNSDPRLHRVSVNGATLHYMERGTGTPIVLVHGALEDYRKWNDRIVDSLALHHRVITYSRRYNFPNNNRPGSPDFSAETEAADLAAFIREIGAGPVHVVGHSFGGLAAVFLAVKNPELVRSLVLSEPAIFAWLPGLLGGDSLRRDFNERLLKPVRASFEANDRDGVLRKTLAYFAGADVLDQLSQDDREVLTRNLPEWQATALSNDAFPAPTREEARQIKQPTLLITGDSTLPLLRLTNDEIERVLPTVKRVRIPQAAHELWETHPDEVHRAIASFLATSQGDLPPLR